MWKEGVGEETLARWEGEEADRQDAERRRTAAVEERAAFEAAVLLALPKFPGGRNGPIRREIIMRHDMARADATTSGYSPEWYEDRLAAFRALCLEHGLPLPTWAARK